MGIITKQSINSSIYIYFGILIGFISSAIIGPSLLEPEQKGILDFANSITTVIASICTLGLPLTVIRIFPFMKVSEAKKQNFIQFMWSTTLLGILIGLGCFAIYFFGFSNEFKNDRTSYFFALAAFIAITFKIIFKNMDALERMSFKSVTGAFLESIVVKILVLVSFLAYWQTKNIHLTFWLFIIALSSPGVIMLFRAIIYNRLKIFNWVSINKLDEKKEIKNLALYGLLGSIGSALVLSIDQLMITEMLGLEQTGIYSLGFFFGIFISTPSRGIKRIATAVLSDSWVKKDMENIKTIYQKSCINQIIIGIYLFLGIWFGIDYLFEYMKPEYAAAKYVILFIGLAQLVEMSTGVNYEVIASSEYYRYNTYFVLLLILLVLISNLILIPIWGINGAAIASLGAMTMVNILRFTFLYFKFKLQPFELKLLIPLAIGAGCYFLDDLIPVIENNLFGLIVHGGLLTLVFWPLIIISKVSLDINGQYSNLLKKIRRKK